MKKIIALIIVLTMCLSLCACSAKNEEVSNQDEAASSKEEAFDNSQKAFNLVTEAYNATRTFSEDLYEAWRLGVNSRKEYDDDNEFADFCSKMNIDQQYIEQAVGNLMGKDAYEYKDWSRLPYRYNGSHFSAWVSVISEAYVCSGDVDSITEKLNEAKNLMKALSDEYSDYEHYPSLKKYFTNTLAYFDFCKHPEGSFEQVVNTINNYRNNAREYFFDLNYVFADSIDGMR